MAPSCYSIHEAFTEAPSNAHFQLHNRDEYEIFMFLKGDSKYIVEDRSYTLEPCDIIIIHKHEMHRIYHNHAIPYRRAIFMVSPVILKSIVVEILYLINEITGFSTSDLPSSPIKGVLPGLQFMNISAANG